MGRHGQVYPAQDLEDAERLVDAFQPDRLLADESRVPAQRRVAARRPRRTLRWRPPRSSDRCAPGHPATYVAGYEAVGEAS